MCSKFKIIIGLSFFVVFTIGCSKSDDSAQGQQDTFVHPELPSGELVFSTPEGWIEVEPQSSMRFAEFNLPGKDGAGDAVMACFHLKGAAGGIEQNLQRWYGQFEQPDGSASADHAQKTKVGVNGMQVTVVYLTGTYKQPKELMVMNGPTDNFPNYALLGAIIPTKNGVWFFKATGPQKTIDAWRPAFDEFVQNFKLRQPSA